LICYAGIEPANPPRARRAALAVMVFLAVAAAAGCGGTVQTRDGGGEAAINPLLGPSYSQWLVGPIARMATAEEMDAYLALSDDAAAAAFIEAFWERRDPAPARPDNPLRDTFEERAHEADRRYTESGYTGRRTDRGTTYILFGEPEKTDHEIPPHPDDPPVEVWFYPADAPSGLSGETPAPVYRFIKRGDVTTFFTPRSLDDPRRRGMPRIDEF
jgi:GWxTD domain-containing protein